MLEEKDIERLMQAFEQVFVTKAELREAMSNLASRDSINAQANLIEVYAHKADAYFHEMVMLSPMWMPSTPDPRRG
jgi:uncharacterized protein Yka (UPF0111/DUF47 family)